MINKTKSFFDENFFSKHFPLDYRIYMIFFFVSYFVALMAAIVNTILFSGILFTIPQWLFVSAYTYLLFVTPKTRMSFQKIHLVFITMVYIPFIYFQTDGYNGTALLFSVIGMLVLTVTFTGKARVAVILTDIAVNISCVLVNYYIPSAVVPLDSLETKVIDLILSLIMAFGAIAVITAFIMKAFQDKNDELAEITIRDALTGVYNRRFLFDYLEQLLNSKRLSDQRFCALMMDLDHFKVINDTYGHSFGDKVLHTFAVTAQGVLREEDILARYGGEEFVILLHNVTIPAAEAIAERIRQAVSELRFDNGVQLTVSIGLAKAHPDDTGEELLKKADQYLYQAKDSGRNRICRPGLC